MIARERDADGTMHEVERQTAYLGLRRKKQRDPRSTSRSPAETDHQRADGAPAPAAILAAGFAAGDPCDEFRILVERALAFHPGGARHTRSPPGRCPGCRAIRRARGGRRGCRAGSGRPACRAPWRYEQPSRSTAAACRHGSRRGRTARPREEVRQTADRAPRSKAQGVRPRRRADRPRRWCARPPRRAPDASLALSGDGGAAAAGRRIGFALSTPHHHPFP